MILFSLLAFFLWGIWGVLGKCASPYLTPKQLVVFSTLGYVIVFPVILLFARKEILVSISNKGMWLALLAGCLSSMAYIFYYLAISKGEASRIVTITALYPVVSCLLAFVFLKEPLTGMKIAGIVCSIIGIVLLSL